MKMIKFKLVITYCFLLMSTSILFSQDNSYQRIFSLSNKTIPSGFDILLVPSHPTDSDSISIIAYTTSSTSDSRHSKSFSIQGNLIQVNIKTIESIAQSISIIIDTFKIGSLANGVYTLKIKRERRTGFDEGVEVFSPYISTISYFIVGALPRATQSPIENFTLNLSSGSESLLIFYQNYPSSMAPINTVKLSNDTIYTSSILSSVLFQASNPYIDTFDLGLLQPNKNYVLKHSLRDSLGCMFWRADTIIHLKTSTALSELGTTSMPYPNPVNETIFLDTRYIGSVLQIIDMTGKIVFAEICSNRPICIQSLPSGMYLIKVGKDVFKIIKE